MLKFKIRNQQISRVDSFRPVEKSVNYLYAEFTFCTDDWDGAEKKAVCRNLSSGQTYDAPITNNKCLIPWESINEKGSFELSVWGTVGDVTVPTGVITVELGRTLPRGIESDPPSPTEIDLIKQDIADIKEKLEQSGTADPEEIQKIVDEYLEANPPAETDPTVPGWAKQPEKPAYTAFEVGADTSGTAAGKVSEHNTDPTSHNDIRLELKALSDRINAVLDSDDTTLDELSEIVAYIKSNKTLIDAVTTSKVSITDIIDNLVTNVANKPLSAAQGVVLHDLIQEVRGLVPTDEHINSLIDNKLDSGGNVDLGVTGATVGQTVKISAVDENGVPTAWEAVDFPSGWECIAQSILPEDIPPSTRFSVEFDNPIPIEELTEMFVVYYAVGSDQNSAEYACPLEYITNNRLTNYINANFLIRKASTTLYATTHFFWLNDVFRHETISGTQTQSSNIGIPACDSVLGFAMFPTAGYLGKGTTITVWVRRR